jgi:hypothetical protein
MKKKKILLNITPYTIHTKKRKRKKMTNTQQQTHNTYTSITPSATPLPSMTTKTEGASPPLQSEVSVRVRHDEVRQWRIREKCWKRKEGEEVEGRDEKKEDSDIHCLNYYKRN